MLKLSGAFAAGAALTACAAPTPAAPAPTEPTAAPAVAEPTLAAAAEAVASAKRQVELWTGFGQGRMADAMAGAIQRFDEKQDDYTVQHIVVPWGDIRNKVLAATAAGNPPDVYRGWAWIVGDDAPIGGLTDLTPYVEATSNFNADDIWPATLEQMKYDGKVYGMSISTMVQLFFYNMDRMQEAGISTDTLPTDLEGWEEIGEKLYELSGNSIDKVGFSPWIPFYLPMAWGATRGMTFWNADEQKVEIDMDKGVDMLNWHKGYADKYGAEELQAFMSAYGGNNFGRNTPEGVYYTGRLALWAVQTWLFNDMKEYGPDVNFDVTKMPSPKGTEGAMPGDLVANMYLVPKGAKQPEGGFQFGHFMGSDPWVALNKAVPDSVTPSRKSLANDPEVEKAAPWIKIARDEVLPYAYPQPSMPSVGKYNAELQGAIERVLWENADPETALQDALDATQRDVDAKLKMS
jgi:multiple sugar transport system substrate-binding protein